MLLLWYDVLGECLGTRSMPDLIDILLLYIFITFNVLVYFIYLTQLFLIFNLLLKCWYLFGKLAIALPTVWMAYEYGQGSCKCMHMVQAKWYEIRKTIWYRTNRPVTFIKTHLRWNQVCSGIKSAVESSVQSNHVCKSLYLGLGWLWRHTYRSRVNVKSYSGCAVTHIVEIRMF